MFALITFGVVLLLIGGVLVMVRTWYRRVQQGQALVVNTTNQQIVTFVSRRDGQ